MVDKPVSSMKQRLAEWEREKQSLNASYLRRPIVPPCWSI